MQIRLRSRGRLNTTMLCEGSLVGMIGCDPTAVSGAGACAAASPANAATQQLFSCPAHHPLSIDIRSISSSAVARISPVDRGSSAITQIRAFNTARPEALVDRPTGKRRPIFPFHTLPLRLRVTRRTLCRRHHKSMSSSSSSSPFLQPASCGSSTDDVSASRCRNKQKQR